MLVLLLASGCHGAGAAPGAETSDAGDDSAPVAADDSSSPDMTACDDYVAAMENNPRCGGAPLPADALAHMQARFRPVCARLLALPGTQFSLATFEQCAQSMASLPCGGAGDPLACPPLETTPGTLPATAYCQIDAQCDSDNCITSGGVCGYCNQGIAPGQACGGQTRPGPPPPICDVGTSCVQGTCQAVTPGSAGQPCNNGCATGLFCTEGGTCRAPAGPGQPCNGDYECQPRLECLNGTCQGPEPVGGPCHEDAQCVDSVCVYGATSGTCTSVAWANPGEACSASTRCIYGSCPFPYPSGTGTCPQIIPDGQPCPSDSTQTCDVYSSCVAGTCQPWLSQSCQ